MTLRRFYDLWKRRESDSFTRRLAWFCANKSGRWGEQLCTLISNNDIEALCTFSIDYSDISPSELRDLRYARQCLAFYSKDADLSIRDTEKVSYYSFLKSEYQNCITNQRWSTVYQSGKLFTCEDGLIFAISRKITDILGDCPSISDLQFEFGPGSSTNVRKRTSPRFKLDAALECSTNMETYVKTCFPTDYPLYAALHKGEYVMVPGELLVVPKNALSGRTIQIDPTLNTPVQKGVGKILKERLTTFGNPLGKGAQELNQLMARTASVDGKAVTVDVKRASESLCSLVVFHNLPIDWFELLDQLRTSEVDCYGRVRKLELFSSMGNGFTFELETIIFLAIALVVCERKGADRSLVRVYGDDIIIPTECYDDLVHALCIYGFEVNKTKTYSSGPFRESCGGDYFLGQDIRPFYKRDRWTNARLTGLLNKDYRGARLFDSIRRDLIVDFLGQVPYGLDGFGDGHLVTESVNKIERERFRVKRSPKQRHKHGDLDGWFFNTIVKIPKTDPIALDIGDQLFPLYDIYAKPSLRKFTTYVSPGPEYTHLRTGEWVRGAKMREVLYIPTDGTIEAFEEDPYTIRGDTGSRKTRIYILP